MERQLSPSEREVFKKLRKNYFGLSGQFHKTEDFNARIKSYCIQMYSSRRVFGSTLGEDVFKYFSSKCDCKIFVNNDKSLEKKQRVSRVDFQASELAMFWGNEMEPKVKRMLYEAFGLSVMEAEMYIYPKDNGIVAKPDGIILDNLPEDCFIGNSTTQEKQSIKELQQHSFVTNTSHQDLRTKGLIVEIKVMFSQMVPVYPRVDNLLQSLQEMACSGADRCLLIYYYPSCTKIWMLRFDSHFWNTILEPMITLGSYKDDKLGVKVGQESVSTTNSNTTQIQQQQQKTLSGFEQPIFFSIIDQTLDNQIQLDPESLTSSFNARLMDYFKFHSTLVFLAEKSIGTSHDNPSSWSYMVNEKWKSHFNQTKFESFNGTFFTTLF